MMLTTAVLPRNEATSQHHRVEAPKLLPPPPIQLHHDRSTIILTTIMEEGESGLHLRCQLVKVVVVHLWVMTTGEEDLDNRSAVD